MYGSPACTLDATHTLLTLSGVQVFISERGSAQCSEHCMLILPSLYQPKAHDHQPPTACQAPPIRTPPTSVALVSTDQSCSSCLFALGTCSTTATILGMPAVMFCTYWGRGGEGRGGDWLKRRSSSGLSLLYHAL